jgi:hypothetical protein
MEEFSSSAIQIKKKKRLLLYIPSRKGYVK